MQFAPLGPSPTIISAGWSSAEVASRTTKQSVDWPASIAELVMALVKTVTYSTLLSPSTSSSTAKEGPFQLLRQPVIAPSSKLPQAMRFSSDPAAVRTRSSKQIAPSNLPNTSCKQSSGKAASHVHFTVVHSLATGYSARYWRSLDPPH